MSLEKRLGSTSIGVMVCALARFAVRGSVLLLLGLCVIHLLVFPGALHLAGME